MRTTISIDDAFMSDIRRLAAARGQSVSRFIEVTLRDAIARGPGRMAEEPPFELVTFAGTGTASGVRWDRLGEVDDDLP